MLYVCIRRADGKFGIMDTDDGIVEYKTVREIDEIVNQCGLPIEGVEIIDDHRLKIHVVTPKSFEYTNKVYIEDRVKTFEEMALERFRATGKCNSSIGCGRDIEIYTALRFLGLNDLDYRLQNLKDTMVKLADLCRFTNRSVDCSDLDCIFIRDFINHKMFDYVEIVANCCIIGNEISSKFLTVNFKVKNQDIEFITIDFKLPKGVDDFKRYAVEILDILRLTDIRDDKFKVLMRQYRNISYD